MYRFTWMSNKWQGMEINDLQDEVANLEEFVTSGEPVLLIDNLEDLEMLNIAVGEVVVYD